MRNANSMGASKVIIIGENEVAAGTVTVKDMGTGEQETVDREEFLGGVE
jgi:histidyl-tRNA synthetase